MMTTVKISQGIAPLKAFILFYPGREYGAVQKEEDHDKKSNRILPACRDKSPEQSLYQPQPQSGKNGAGHGPPPDNGGNQAFHAGHQSYVVAGKSDGCDHNARDRAKSSRKGETEDNERPDSDAHKRGSIGIDGRGPQGLSKKRAIKKKGESDGNQRQDSQDQQGLAGYNGPQNGELPCGNQGFYGMGFGAASNENDPLQNGCRSDSNHHKGGFGWKPYGANHQPFKNHSDKDGGQHSQKNRRRKPQSRLNQQPSEHPASMTNSPVLKFRMPVTRNTMLQHKPTMA